MFAVEIYAAVRRFVFIEGNSRREAARVFGLSRDTIAKMCRYSAPPGYVRTKAPERPKLGPLLPVIDAILESDKTAGLFRPEDNLESVYGRTALRQLYQLFYAGKVEGCSLTRFQEATGLDLTDQYGSLKEELPPISTFLNRILALPIALQNRLFEVFEGLMEASIEAAVQAGIFDVGVETVTAESLVVANRQTIAAHERSGAQTSLVTIARKDRTRVTMLDEAFGFATASQKSRLMINTQSGRAAIKLPAPGLMQDDGTVQARVRLLHPVHRDLVTVEALERSHWREATSQEFRQAWEAEVAALPEFTESAFNIVTGLLLPVWNRLPDETARVYRLQTDEGERIIGRLVSSANAVALAETFGAEAPALPPRDAIAAVVQDGASLVLADGLVLKRSLVMNRQRLEFVGFTVKISGYAKKRRNSRSIDRHAANDTCNISHLYLV